MPSPKGQKGLQQVHSPAAALNNKESKDQTHQSGPAYAVAAAGSGLGYTPEGGVTTPDVVNTACNFSQKFC